MFSGVLPEPPEPCMAWDPATLGSCTRGHRPFPPHSCIRKRWRCAPPCFVGCCSTSLEATGWPRLGAAFPPLGALPCFLKFSYSSIRARCIFKKPALQPCSHPAHAACTRQPPAMPSCFWRRGRADLFSRLGSPQQQLPFMGLQTSSRLLPGTRPPPAFLRATQFAPLQDTLLSPGPGQRCPVSFPLPSRLQLPAPALIASLPSTSKPSSKTRGIWATFCMSPACATCADPCSPARLPIPQPARPCLPCMRPRTASSPTMR